MINPIKENKSFTLLFLNIFNIKFLSGFVKKTFVPTY